MDARHTAWVFTWNNWTPASLEAVAKLAAKASWCIVADEVGEETGTPHLQGYMCFQNARSKRSMVNHLTVKDAKANGTANTADIAKATGSAKHQLSYIGGKPQYVYPPGHKKSGVSKVHGTVILETGEMPKPGHRTDLDEVQIALREGANLRDIQDMTPNPQAHRAAGNWFSTMERVRDFEPEVYWIFGAPRSGKSTYVKTLIRKVNGDAYWFAMANDTAVWWDGYDAHTDIVIDDLEPRRFRPKYLLYLLGADPARLNLKGSFRQNLARRIYVTTLLDPIKFWNLCAGSQIKEEPYEQLAGRITTVRHWVRSADAPPPRMCTWETVTGCVGDDPDPVPFIPVIDTDDADHRDGIPPAVCRNLFSR